MAVPLRIGHAPAVRSAAERADELSKRQFGAISRRQLLELGNSRSRIAHWLITGRLHLRYPGVYAWGRADLSTAGELAAGLLHAGPGAVLTGVSALWWMGLLHRRPHRIHIDAPGRSSSWGDVRVTHSGSIERAWERGLPVAPLPVALLAATADLSRDSLRLVLARAEFKGTLEMTSLFAALGHGRRGSRALRAALDAHLPALARCANGLERDFVLLCERHRLPIPEPNVRIGRYRPDMLWREARLIVELDGKDAHSTPAQLEADECRQAWLERRGYTVLRFTAAELRLEPDRVAAEVARHLGL